MSDKKEAVVIRALIHIIENQIKLKQRLGIIREHDRWCDSEYAYDMNLIDELLETI